MKSLFMPTLVRRVVLALLCAFSIAWVMLMAVQYREVRHNEVGDAGTSAFIAATADALSYVTEPNELRILAIATFKQANTQLMRDQRSSLVLVKAWDREQHRMVFASAGAEDVTLPESDVGGTVLQSVRGEAHVVHVATSPRWALMMAVPRITERWLLKELGVSLSKYMVIAFPFVLLPVWLAVRQGLRPLQRLSDRIAARSPDDLSALAVDPTYAELKPLVSVLDELMTQLRIKIGREHAFVQDAAHELRTPMAVISAQAHVLAKAADDLRKVGSGLSTAVNNYNSFVSSFETRSLVTARKFRDLNIEPGRRDIDVLAPVEALPRYSDEELALSDNDPEEPPQIAAE